MSWLTQSSTSPLVFWPPFVPHIFNFSMLNNTNLPQDMVDGGFAEWKDNMGFLFLPFFVLFLGPILISLLLVVVIDYTVRRGEKLRSLPHLLENGYMVISGFFSFFSFFFSPFPFPSPYLLPFRNHQQKGSPCLS